MFVFMLAFCTHGLEKRVLADTTLKTARRRFHINNPAFKKEGTRGRMVSEDEDFIVWAAAATNQPHLSRCFTHCSKGNGL